MRVFTSVCVCVYVCVCVCVCVCVVCLNYHPMVLKHTKSIVLGHELQKNDEEGEIYTNKATMKTDAV